MFPVNLAAQRRTQRRRLIRATRDLAAAAFIATLALTLARAALDTALAIPVLTGHATPWKDLQ
jgi:hypothetical protein